MSRKQTYLTVTDQFCGAGGSSVGAQAAGCEILMAMNHWKLAVETHNTNFPQTDHDCCDISACDPHRYRSSDILITSPECTNHSISKGKQRKNLGQLDLFNPQPIDPSEERSRATMWDVVRFAEYHQYNLIIVENVVEVRYWTLFDAWLEAMRVLGYAHEAVFFNSMFAAPTPQSRDRIYIVFWKVGNRKPNLEIKPLANCPSCHQEVQAIQTWKNPYKRWGRYGKRNQYIYNCPVCHGEVQPYFTPAYSAIDWSFPSQRIGDRARPLKPATLERIHKGLAKFNSHLIVETLHTQDKSSKVRSLDEPMATQTTRQTQAIVAVPFIVRHYGGSRPGSLSSGADEPMPTVTTVDHNSLVQPFLVTERFEGVAQDLSQPIPTVMAGRTHHRLVQPFMVTLRNQNSEQSVEQPLDTVVASGQHHGLVQPMMLSYYSRSDEMIPISQPVPTVSTVDRHALIQPSTVLRVEDCYFRMLQPHEIHRAMAFPEEYVVLGNKRERIKQYGNAVTPPVMQILVERCIETLS